MSRRALTVVATTLFSLGLVGACSDPPSKPAAGKGGIVTAGGAGGGGSGEGGVDANVDANIDGGACNDVVLNGQLVDRTGVSGDPPVATGGLIPDGSYDLTDFTVYVGVGGVAGPTGITARATLRVGGGKFDKVLELGGNGKTSTTTLTSAAFVVNGSSVAETILCPIGGGGMQVQFSSNPPQLVLTDLVSKEAFTYTKR